MAKQQFPFECRFCANLGEPEDPLPGEEGHLRCTFGRFDADTPSGKVPQYFAWSGIWRPNKKVAEAQKGCPNFELHPQVLLISRTKGIGITHE